MLPYQRDFLNLALARKALRFGEFTLKSGRVSPYFFNAGMIDSGAALAALGRAYAQAALNSGVEFDMLFGPAYKGISLATAAAIALSETTQRDVPVAFNVITAGTAIRESLALIHAHGATPAGVLIALDRQERGQGALSAVQEVEAEFGIPVIAIARLAQLFALIAERPELNTQRERLDAYRHAYASTYT